MKLRNSTDFSDAFLRRMVAWIRRQMKLPAAKLRQAQFTRCRWVYRGRAFGGGAMLVRIGPAESYPYSGRRNKEGPQFTLTDRIEGLVKITAHEMAHHIAWHNGYKWREAEVDVEALRILKLFREQRIGLLEIWDAKPAEKPAKPAKPKPSVVERRAAKAEADLARWQRKMKLAATKVRKLKARVRYYEKRTQAADRSQA